MKRAKKILMPGLLLGIIAAVYWEIWFKGFVPLPADGLTGMYFPWLDFKWGYQVGVPVKNSLLSDAFGQFFVWKKIAIDYLMRGQMPLWNPYTFSGTPLLATFHSAALFPANILMFLGNKGWSLYIFCSTAAAAIAMYLFLGNHVKSQWAKAAGSLVFAFGGLMTTWVEFGTGVWAAAGLPWVMWCIDEYVLKGKRKFMAGAAAGLGAIGLAGQVQIFTYVVPLVLIYALWRKAKMTGVVLACVLGAALAGIQLVPTWGLYSQSIRGQDRYIEKFDWGLSPWGQIIRWWAADFFGNHVTGNDYSRVGYHEYSSFWGTLSIPLILALLFSKKKKGVNFFLMLWSGIVLLAYNNPVSRALYQTGLPLLTYSIATRLFFVMALAAGGLAAYGIENLEDRDFRKKTGIAAVILIFVTIAASSGVEEAWRITAVRNSVIPIAILGTWILLVFVGGKKRVAWGLVVLLLLAPDLGRYFRKYNPFVPARLVFPVTGTINYLIDNAGKGRIARQYGPVMPPNTWAYYGLSGVEGYDPMRLLSYNRFFHLAENQPVLSAAGRYSELGSVNLKYWDALGIKYYLTVKEPDLDHSPQAKELMQAGWKEVNREGRTLILENPGSTHKGFFVVRTKGVINDNEAAAILEVKDFDPRTEAVITGPVNRDWSDGVINNWEERGGRVDARVSGGAGGSFLVVANGYDTGWKAKVDGQQVEVKQTDIGFQGVEVPEGVHILQMRYWPDEVTAGAAVTGIGLMGVVGIWLIKNPIV
ncbi:hypothetical protein A2701_03090 [Candidatus Amesbacteria bacterium RIFCSPHIGHO2_01_FULL_47_34]|uniref:Membrane protein 6-pyruvoyl-tetrahydropterin synthase-related domain-containing protein n=1 Tax=Candidatus Amesbacteria bacterium RIFCSPLOWO2_01_FULL_47_33 TaxID=1797258 RepID=A0A1F4Z5U4_9BACT|nr:MAG: hypothetical protein A2701_03090 [Candidatus Amesbacteria bacterium RIFCSPHIGHO2_01_FULL_47_34]OGD01387.1 MAG: hypothetical protein A2972_04135 [Candidatus Amesbacteria bacterium RIFCSPLOWO2_01_FULL_47_33]